MHRAPLLSAFALLLVLPFTSATHTPMGWCGSGGEPALGIVEVTGGTPDTTFYIDDRNMVTGRGLWYYAETNGIWMGRGAGVFRDDVAAHNVQRGVNAILMPDDHEDLCVDDPTVPPDRPLPFL